MNDRNDLRVLHLAVVVPKDADPDLLRGARIEVPGWPDFRYDPLSDEDALLLLLTDPCPTCRGKGWIAEHFMNDDGEYHGVHEHVCRQCPVQVKCPQCGGRGWTPKQGVTLERSFNGDGEVRLSLVVPLLMLEEQ